MQISNRITKVIYDSIFYFTTFWIAGYFFFPLGKIHDQVFILIFVLPAIWLLARKEITFKPFLKSRVFCLILAYCLFWIISTFWGTYNTNTLHLSAIKSALYIYLFWVIIFTTFYLEEKKLALLFKCIIICAVINVFVNLYLFYGLDHATINDRFNGFGRLRNPLWVAALYGAMSIVMLSCTIQPNTKNKFLYFSLFILFFVATVLTHSRTPIISMMAVSAFLFYTSNLPIKTKVLTTLIMLCLFVLSVILFNSYLLEDIERGQSYRLDLWIGFLDIVKHNVLFGSGAETNVFIKVPGSLVDGWSHYHNIYLGTLVELGLIGLILHIVLVIYTAIIAWRNRADFYTYTALMVFIFTCLIGITYGQGIITNKNAQWIIFWLPLAIIVMHELHLVDTKKPVSSQYKIH